MTFRSVYDGSEDRFTPEGAAEIQRRLGLDIAMCLDVCLPAEAPSVEFERAVRLTTQWAERQVDAPRAPGQLRFGISQGATDDELRRRSIAEITALGFDGFALGGLAVGESVDEMLECVDWAAPLLPVDSPRYFMGIGDPRGILEVVSRGIDLFDCVLPTRQRGPAPRSPGRGGSTSRTPSTARIHARSTIRAGARRASGSRARTCATS